MLQQQKITYAYIAYSTLPPVALSCRTHLGHDATLTCSSSRAHYRKTWHHAQSEKYV